MLSKQIPKAETETRAKSRPIGFRLNALRPILAYVLPPMMALTVLAIAWEIWTRSASIPVYIVPAPSVIMGRLFGNIGFFAGHGAITLLEAISGFILGAVLAVTGATLMAHSRFLERSLYPLAILVKVTPIVTYAPLFLIWFGFGYLPIILIAAAITFFPVLVNALTGFRSVNPTALDFFNSLRASRREIFLKLRVPSSLPYLFAAFKIAIPLSVIGTVVGEFFSGNQGLGSVVFVAYHNLDMPTLFSAMLSLAFMGISLTIATSYIESRTLFWHESSVVP